MVVQVPQPIVGEIAGDEVLCLFQDSVEATTSKHRSISQW
jgi:hypothetical protein